MPADYVNKLARMFQDIKVSEDLNQQFKEMRSDKIAGMQLHVVLRIYFNKFFITCALY